MKITYTVNDAIVPELIEATCGLHSVPDNEDGEPLFSEAQWAKEYWRRCMKRDLGVWRRRKAQALAQPIDDGAIT